MAQNMTTIAQYFALSDLAPQDLKAQGQINNLFADNATVTAADGTTITGKPAIAAFFKAFFTRNQQLRHLQHTVKTVTGYQAQWAVVGQKAGPTLFTLQGYDDYRFTPAGKISRLQVTTS
ncbi:hypothetical protein FC83_GL001912 [Agrilactobacillus composti DSM 18527 = JCM 14202]|uniref:SnoaL-like domain-containing protein n=1 Tax=Agrilactobacillus composti DSM 18527 = JCM 14202 TaxID=1423734 RepID=X0PGB8_9LACO|nr:nuclear transport factor 2 family protein [Agrilactobacillus composti]KRM34976.1 hypothetical protein FC83_GL001912 [Agrilactobacillus composti DSM 18527 = JCM 14202]GAF41049.1 hypothetical protein JCM14202_2967 [Agrilactobacillus composti DSM 18527 = JCM 14202]